MSHNAAWNNDPWGMPTIMDITVDEVMKKNIETKEQGNEIIKKYKLSSGDAFADELRKRVKARYKHV